MAQRDEARAIAKRLVALAKDVSSNYDHEDDAHKYNNGCCRMCNAQAAIEADAATIAKWGDDDESA